MEKFAKDDRLELLSVQKRKLKEIEHRNEIERLWKEKLGLY